MRSLFFALMIILFTSCDTVYYADPQPRFWPSLPSFPPAVQGNYPLFQQPNGIVITSNALVLNVEEVPKRFVLNEDVVIKRYRKYWIISLYNQEHDGWEIYAVDKNRGVKTLHLKKSLPATVNEKFRRDLFTYDSTNELVPLKLRRREFKYLLEHHFEGIDFTDNTNK